MKVQARVSTLRAGARTEVPVTLDLVPGRTEEAFIPARPGVPQQDRVFHRVWVQDLQRHDIHPQLIISGSAVPVG